MLVKMSRTPPPPGLLESVVLEWEWDLESAVEWESEEGLVGGLDLESAVPGCVLVSVGVVGVVGVTGGFCAAFSLTGMVYGMERKEGSMNHISVMVCLAAIQLPTVQDMY